MPAARHRFASSTMALAVKPMIGVRGRPVRHLMKPDRLGGAETIHHGHLQVHQDRVEAGLLAGRLFGPSPIEDDRDDVPLGFERRGDDLGIHGIVLGQ